MNEFLKRLDPNDSDQNKEDRKKFFHPIKRAEWKSFSNTNKKVKVNINGSCKDISVQRDVLGLSAAASQQNDASVSIDDALSYPLTPVPLSLETSDGVRRKTTKSKLYDLALPSLQLDESTMNEVTGDISCYILDLAAYLRYIQKPPDEFKDLAIIFLNSLLSFILFVIHTCN